MNITGDGVDGKPGGAITQIDEVPDDFLDTLMKFDKSNTLGATDNGGDDSR